LHNLHGVRVIRNLAKVAAKQAGVTQQQARAVLDAVKGAIVTHLKKGEDVRLKGLGKFYAKHRNAHNPKTGGRASA